MASIKEAMIQRGFSLYHNPQTGKYNLEEKLDNFQAQGGSLTELSKVAEVSFSHLQRIVAKKVSASPTAKNRILSGILDLEKDLPKVEKGLGIVEKSKPVTRKMTRVEFHREYWERRDLF